jgi:AraC-like DNA-binding protein
MARRGASVWNPIATEVETGNRGASFKRPARMKSRSISKPQLDRLAASIAGLFDVVEGVQFWIKDRTGHYRWVNRAFLQNYSLERMEQVTGKTDHDLSPSHLADQYVQDDERVLRGEAVEKRIELVGRFDHTSRWCQTTKRAVRDDRGRIIGTIGITRVADPRVVQADMPDAALGRVLAHMREHFAEPLANPDLARMAGRSVRAFERLFVKQMQMTPQQYLRRLRVRLACQALIQHQSPMVEIAVSHGFYDQSHFVREFRRETGLTPGEYRARYAT